MTFNAALLDGISSEVVGAPVPHDSILTPCGRPEFHLAPISMPHVCLWHVYVAKAADKIHSVLCFKVLKRPCHAANSDSTQKTPRNMPHIPSPTVQHPWT